MKRHCPDCGFVNCVCDELDDELDLEEDDDECFDRDELGEDPEDG